MLIKSYFKQNETTRERYTVYKLCESYRLNRSIHHRIIIGFNRLEELEAVEQKKLLAAHIEDMLIKDKRDQPIELLKVSAAGDDDQYLWVRSHAKVFKEHI